jgi:hypothetical protein
MSQLSHISGIATLVVGAASMAALGQFLLMPEFHALEAEVVTVFVRGVPQ